LKFCRDQLLTFKIISSIWENYKSLIWTLLKIVINNIAFNRELYKICFRQMLFISWANFIAVQSWVMKMCAAEYNKFVLCFKLLELDITIFTLVILERTHTTKWHSRSTVRPRFTGPAKTLSPFAVDFNAIESTLTN
jgi:hypothetical protein